MQMQTFKAMFEFRRKTYTHPMDVKKKGNKTEVADLFPFNPEALKTKVPMSCMFQTSHLIAIYNYFHFKRDVNI